MRQGRKPRKITPNLFEEKLRQISKRWKWNAVLRTAYSHWLVLNEYDIDSDHLSMTSAGSSVGGGLTMSSLSSCGLSLPDTDAMHVEDAIDAPEMAGSHRELRHERAAQQPPSMREEAISLPAVYKLSVQATARPRPRPLPLHAPGTAGAASKSALEVSCPSPPLSSLLQ
jgi:hypothetical protein